LETIETDVVIVGGGPAGCSCALYTSRADLKTVILDKNPDVGALAITHQIANYPGVSSEMSGEALLKLMRDQAIQYGADYRRAQVFGIDANGDWKTIYTPEGTFKAKAPVISGGCCLPINKIYGFSKSFPIKTLLIERPPEVLPNSDIVTFLTSLIILYQVSYHADDNISWAEIYV